MFSLFKKKQKEPDIRDILFGDVPLSQWPDKTKATEVEPWQSFKRAREYIKSSDDQAAAQVYKNILEMPDLESRHYLQAWHFLRKVGIQPDQTYAKDIIGIIVEVPLQEGLDLLAAYDDGTARYFNYSGAGVVWDAPDSSLKDDIERVLLAGKRVVSEIGLWESVRPQAPPLGQARINILTPSGLHFKQATLELLATDQLSGPVFAASTQLMESLIAKTKES